MRCPTCNGKGWIWADEYNPYRRCMEPVQDHCGPCNGSGERPGEDEAEAA